MGGSWCTAFCSASCLKPAGRRTHAVAQTLGSPPHRLSPIHTTLTECGGSAGAVCGGAVLNRGHVAEGPLSSYTCAPSSLVFKAQQMYGSYAFVVDSGAQRRVLGLGCTVCGVLPCAVGGSAMSTFGGRWCQPFLWVQPPSRRHPLQRGPESMGSDTYMTRARSFSGGQMTAVRGVLCLSSTHKAGVLSLGIRFIFRSRARPVEVAWALSETSPFIPRSVPSARDGAVLHMPHRGLSPGSSSSEAWRAPRVNMVQPPVPRVLAKRHVATIDVTPRLRPPTVITRYRLLYSMLRHRHGICTHLPPPEGSVRQFSGPILMGTTSIVSPFTYFHFILTDFLYLSFFVCMPALGLAPTPCVMGSDLCRPVLWLLSAGAV